MKRLAIIKLLSVALSTAVLCTGAISAFADTKDVGSGTTIEEPTSDNLYTVNLTFDPKDYDGTINHIAIAGEFMFYESNLTGNTDKTGMMDMKEKIVPGKYEPGMKPIGGYYYEEMKYDESKSVYTATVKLPAGVYNYRFVVNGTISEPATDSMNWSNVYTTDGVYHGVKDGDWILDPKNKPVVPTATGGQYCCVLKVGKDKNNPWLPDENLTKKGTVSFISYNDINNTTQSLGVYLPADYDKNNYKPYKVIYVSHGGGGNENDWYALGGINNIMDNLIAQGKTQDAIIVTMNNCAYQDETGWNYQKISENMFKCIIPHMEKVYNVSTDVKDRAFCGLSMGGLTTSYMYMHHPSEFGYFGAFSGAFGGGVNFDLSSKDLYNTTLMIGSGEEDMAYNTMDIGLKKFQDELDKTDIKYTSYYVPGGHDWFTWTKLFAYFSENILWK